LKTQLYCIVLQLQVIASPTLFGPLW